MLKRANGFTVIELVFVITLVGFASVLFFIQKNNIKITSDDNMKKTAINAMYYSLEEVFYAQNGYYPSTISTDNLKSVDPALFTDPKGVKFGDAGNAYSYTPTNCTDNKCKSYSLKADLTNEDDYVKTNKN